jgi:predicted phage terminase large subunit-like protein
VRPHGADGMQLNDSNIGQFLSTWHDKRNLARTDLLWLCNEILGYKDVSERVHGPILACLQKFPGADEAHRTTADYIAAIGGKILWSPRCQMEYLPANYGFEQSRDSQYLYPRGHLKSTVITIAHSIQWMLNYPNVRILLTTATELLGQGFIIEIRNHFIQNELLRFLFPDVCPVAKDGRVPELGNLGGFTLPCRDNTNKKLGPGGKEPTLQASTVGSSITGYHGDVQKNDDLVEKINSSSLNGIEDVIRHFGSLWDLLEKYNAQAGGEPLHGWQDTVGTPWDFSDLYQVRRNQQADLASKGLEPTVNLIIASAAPNWPEGPFLWPERMGFKALKAIEDDPTKGRSQLSAQYLMNPIVLGMGLIDDVAMLRWMPHLEMDRIIPKLTLRARMDLAGMDPNAKGADNDYTALTIGGFDDGVLYIPWTRYGRPPTEEVVEWIFEMFAQWPALVQLTVEKASGGSQIEAWLRREMAARGKWLPVTFVTRSNQQSKVTRIKGLRPWFMAGKIALSDAIPYRLAIENEVKGFPKYRHDDWLDTVSDLMYEAKGDAAGGVVSAQTEYSGVVPNQPSVIEMLIAQGNFEDEYAGFDTVTGFAL